MKIAILGWGSLIWQPKELQFDSNIGWSANGPFLPLEFARISKDGRLTLVITPKGTVVQTLYCVSTFNNLEEAVSNLAKREGSGSKSIGYYSKVNSSFFPVDFQFKEEVQNWIVSTDFDAVIWTNLPEKWILNDKTKINPDNRIKYLQNLTGPQSALAEEYIRNTPKQIETEYRKLIREVLGWT